MDLFEFFVAIERYHTFQNPTSEEKLDLAVEYCSIRDGMRILDVGCGKGWLARRIAKRFKVQVTGLEINPVFAEEARRMAEAEGLADRIQIVQGPALEFNSQPESYDVVMCIGASFALGGFEPALDWMMDCAKIDGRVAIGEVFAKTIPLPADLPRNRGYEERTLWMTVEKMQSHGLLLRGLVESSIDDWNRYHSLHWQAALEWAREHPDFSDAARMIDPAGRRVDVEFDGRAIGWAILIGQKSR